MEKTPHHEQAIRELRSEQELREEQKREELASWTEVARQWSEVVPFSPEELSRLPFSEKLLLRLGFGSLPVKRVQHEEIIEHHRSPEEVEELLMDWIHDDAKNENKLREALQGTQFEEDARRYVITKLKAEGYYDVELITNPDRIFATLDDSRSYSYDERLELYDITMDGRHFRAKVVYHSCDNSCDQEQMPYRLHTLTDIDTPYEFKVDFWRNYAAVRRGYDAASNREDDNLDIIRNALFGFLTLKRLSNEMAIDLRSKAQEALNACMGNVDGRAAKIEKDEHHAELKRLQAEADARKKAALDFLSQRAKS